MIIVILNFSKKQLSLKEIFDLPIAYFLDKIKIIEQTIINSKYNTF